MRHAKTTRTFAFYYIYYIHSQTVILCVSMCTYCTVEQLYCRDTHSPSLCLIAYVYKVEELEYSIRHCSICLVHRNVLAHRFVLNLALRLAPSCKCVWVGIVIQVLTNNIGDCQTTSSGKLVLVMVMCQCVDFNIFSCKMLESIVDCILHIQDMLR